MLCDALKRCIDGNVATLPANRPWEEMALLSSHHFVTPAFAWALRDVPDVPPDLREFLDAVLTLNRERNRNIEETLISALQLWNNAGIASILLKGAASLACDLYPDRGMRILGDIDILIPEDRAADAARLLIENGFEPIPTKNDYAGHHHLAPLRHNRLGIAIEIHRHTLFSDCRSVLPTEMAWRAARPCTIGGTKTKCLSPTLQFVHVLAHTQIQDAHHRRRSFALRQMLELGLLARRHSAELDWECIAAHYRAAGYTPVLQNAVEFVVRQFGVQRPKAILPPVSDPLRSVRKRLQNRVEWPGYVIANYSAFYFRMFRERPQKLLGLLHPWRLARHFNDNIVRPWRASKWR
jgi:hypothetical protein